MKPLSSLWVGAVLWFSTSAAHAATLCVGPTASGSGNGSDWSNQKAWSDTPDRGDTWYLADGDYAGKTLGVPESGSTVITIKKANPSDHGPAAGWADTLGDGQATFSSSILFESSHWVFDGQTGGGPGGWNGGFGFKITSIDDATAVVRIAYDNPAPAAPARVAALRTATPATTAAAAAPPHQSRSRIRSSFPWAFCS